MDDVTKQSGNNKKAAPMRHDRDRFVAFAFSSSDMLFELDGDGVVVFASGIGESLGLDTRILEGRKFLDLVYKDDQALVKKALARAGAGTRINSLTMHFCGKTGKTPPMSLSGYQLTDLEGHFFLGAHLDLGGHANTANGAGDGPGDTGEPLPNAADFAARTGEVLAGLGSREEECKLTMIRLGQMQDVLRRLDPESAYHMNAAVSTLLRNTSIGGELAGEIDAENFGLVHSLDTDIGQLTERLKSIIIQADPAGRGVELESATVKLESASRDDQTQSRALSYIFSQFAGADPDDFTNVALSDGLDTMMADAVQRIDDFHEMLNDSGFSIAFQPIVDLKDSKPHHFEALARFDGGGNKSPYETITFAEKTGLIQEFDLAMCAKIIAWMENAARQGRRYKVAVNLSGASVNSPEFIDRLNTLFAHHKQLRPWVMFEVTESSRIEDLQAVNKRIQDLRHVGHKVCLDDFGAGAAAFQYIRDLEVDYVKIDGAYVKGALRTAKTRAFLKAMAGLCRDLNITTVAEMVEDEELLDYLRECRVSYGQGYLFGRPSFDIDVFEAEAPAAFDAAKKKGPK